MILYSGLRGSEPVVQLKSTTTTTTTTTTTVTTMTTTTVTTVTVTTTPYVLDDWHATLSAITPVNISYMNWDGMKESTPQPQGSPENPIMNVFPLEKSRQVKKDDGYATVAFKVQEWKDTVTVKLPGDTCVKI